MKEHLLPSKHLISITSGTEEVDNVLTQTDFFPLAKDIKNKIDEYNLVPEKKFINESYFLYDKSNLILDTFITALNKKISIYGSFSYFQDKTEEEKIRLLSAGNFLKFSANKNTLKDELKFQLTNISGKNPKTKGKKIYDFSITRLGRKRKLSMAEPIETIVVRAQQNFDIVGGLNPIQIELEDDRILNPLKRYKNVMYKVTPLGLLFPASIKNDTSQIFVTCKELDGVTMSILNGKVYNILSLIDLDKINSWKEIKGQSTWINATFKDQREINNNSHLCFPFIARSLNNLLSLQDDKNKETEFNSGKKENKHFKLLN